MNPVNAIHHNTGHHSSAYGANQTASTARRITTLAVDNNLAPTAQRVLSTTASAWTAPLVLQTRRTEVA